MLINEQGIAVVESDTHLSRWICQHGRLDIQRGYLDLFRRYIPEGGFVVDVGACLGDHTLTYSEFVGPSGVVHAYEPNPIAFECLSYNMSKRSNVFCHNAALGARQSSGYLFAEGSEKNLGANQVVEGEGPIKVIALDSQHFARLDFLKIDAEGWEPDVLLGAAETIQRLNPTMLIEINRPILEARGTPTHKVYNIIEDLGYSYRPSEDHHSFSMDMIDVLCIPQK